MIQDNLSTKTLLFDESKTLLLANISILGNGSYKLLMQGLGKML
ncbi:hypothetical protein CASFOL_006992 [Castilleja foliolosa]|uniref:Uncharacterized protein n=1 Tax=Castilleja foliolosa TaxID=1961234 RepID=A0ABD3EBT7_9LAMI